MPPPSPHATAITPHLLFSFLHRRRRPNPSTMPSPPTTISSPQPLTFSSPESLSDWLHPRLPPLSLASWGTTPGTKTLHNLFLELSQGETSLILPHPHHHPPLRSVQVVTLRIRNPRGDLLIESHQILSDGSSRPRLRPLSEKMRPWESVEEAALRAIHEELGEAAAATARIVPGSCETRVEERDSASYPGLPARYVLHSVEAQVEGLPEEGEFATEEGGEGLEAENEKAIFVKRHFWKWIDDDGSGSNSSA